MSWKFSLLVKGVNETKIRQKSKKYVIRMYIGTSILGNLGVKAKIPGQKVVKVGEGMTRTGQHFYCCLILWLILNTKILSK